MPRVPAQIIADPAAATWLTLNATDGADGLSMSLDTDQPIDVQICDFVYSRERLRNSFGINNSSADFARVGGGAAASSSFLQQQASSQQPPPTLGVLMFTHGDHARAVMKKQNLRHPVPRVRSLGLDSMILWSDTLLPGVDSSAAVSGNSADLQAFVHASGQEASPWQIVHSGCTPAELAQVAGPYVSGASPAASPPAPANAPAPEAEAGGGAAAGNAAAPAEGAAAGGPGEENSNDNNEKNESSENNNNENGDDNTQQQQDQQQEQQEQEEQKPAEQPQPEPPQQQSPRPPATPGRMTLVLVGDLLSYCTREVFQMVASMQRPPRPVAPAVVQPELAAFAAQGAVMVSPGGLGVARDGCAVWRPRDSASALTRSRASSTVHTCANREFEDALPTAKWENGCAVFVNHPIGPANVGQTARKNQQNFYNATLQQQLGGGADESSTAYRRTFRITWNDAFLGAEHGGPDGRYRFSAPTVAVGLVHSSQVRRALKKSDQGHVFGNLRDTVMWCLSPDAALFPGPHLHPVRGPGYQCQPHLYVANPLLMSQQQLQQQGNSRTTSQVSSNQNNNSNQQMGNARSHSEYQHAMSTNRHTTHNQSGGPHQLNPTVISTTVTISCDVSMHCVTFMNNGRRVASWDISELWAVTGGHRDRADEDHDDDHDQDGDNQHADDELLGIGGGAAAAAASGGAQPVKKLSRTELASVFYPIVDIAFPGTVVEIVN